MVKRTLSNNVRVLVDPVGHVGSVSIGVWCQTGSVHETPHEAGITHFIEHMLFKGTERRTAKQIAEEIEGRGGNLNAFTDKEATCYYCRVLAEDAEAAIDVLCDMVTGSLLDPEELEREKGVVQEEIKRGEDEPGDHVHDLHIQGIWPESVLGKSVIGTRDSVASFKREHLASYIGRRYKGGNVLVSAAGNVEPDRIVKAVEERLAGLEPSEGRDKPARPAPHPGENLVAKPVEQVHFCIGGEGVGIDDDELFPAVVLDGLVGSGMSSRLFQEVREKRGLAYAVGSYNLVYSAGGAFTVYGGTGKATWDQVREVIRAELDKVMAEGAGEDELKRVKKNLTGTLALSLEGMSSRMIRMARNEINYGREIPLQETMDKINAVTNAQVIELARRILPGEKLRTTAIGPF
ncbi:MAG: insulinase family protein [Fimbriimonadaceae bacterium]|nr:insulinase family protein [Fimbriimonadaceae bacterium]QYK55108.1 MAG: insulinase family protein [Fimbriimonadaceae bacterium]